jgi:hypothetical protein
MSGKLLPGLALVVLFAGLTYAQDADPGADGVGDSLYPQYGNGGYDAQHYTLDLSWEDDTNAISGSVMIEAQATQMLAPSIWISRASRSARLRLTARLLNSVAMAAN